MKTMVGTYASLIVSGEVTRVEDPCLLTEKKNGEMSRKWRKFWQCADITPTPPPNSLQWKHFIPLLLTSAEWMQFSYKIFMSANAFA